MVEDIKNYEGMSVQDKWNILATVANLYYNSDLTQNQIAERILYIEIEDFQNAEGKQEKWEL